MSRPCPINYCNQRCSRFSSSPPTLTPRPALPPHPHRFQIFLAINVIEYLCNKIAALPGYKAGDYLGTGEWVDVSDEGWDSYQTKELNNGRLAMMAIAGVVVQVRAASTPHHMQPHALAGDLCVGWG